MGFSLQMFGIMTVLHPWLVTASPVAAWRPRSSLRRLPQRAQPVAIRAEGDALASPLESEQLLAGLRIPHLHFFGANTGQTFAVRAEEHAGGIIALEGELLLTRPDI